MFYLDADSTILFGFRRSIITLVARAMILERSTVLRDKIAMRSVIIGAKTISRVLLRKQWLVPRTIERVAELEMLEVAPGDRGFSRNRKTHQLLLVP